MAKIYLSATYQDLKPCRDAVYRILRKLHHDVVSMEDYVATDAYPLHKCLSDVASCDIYVGLLGWCYGYIPDKDNSEKRSITEREYRKAGTSKLPQLMFLADSEAPWPDEFKDSVTGEGDNGRRIADFRAELENTKLVSQFRNPDHLAGLVLAAVQLYLADKAAKFPPKYETEWNRELAEDLESAEIRLEEAVVRGDDPGSIKAVQEEILDLKRKLRAGGRVKPGDTLMQGRYKLVEPVGSGGFAVVWKAYDRHLLRLVAIKVLHGQYGDDRSKRARFFRGAREMAALQHQGIVQVLEKKLEDDGYYFFVMEYLAGGDFQQAVLGDRLPLEERLRIILSVGEALRFAHERKIIHRDIKPLNILLDESGQPRLTDFDLVRAKDTTGMTRTGMMGTIVYAAPLSFSSEPLAVCLESLVAPLVPRVVLLEPLWVTSANCW